VDLTNAAANVILAFPWISSGHRPLIQISDVQGALFKLANYCAMCETNSTGE